MASTAWFCWVILGAICSTQLTVLSPAALKTCAAFFDCLGGGDLRIQAILIAPLLRRSARGTGWLRRPRCNYRNHDSRPGVKPLQAAITVLLANTAPVAFGAVVVPITTAADVGGDAHVIATIVGHQAPFPAMLVLPHPARHPRRYEGPEGRLLPLIIGVSPALLQWATALPPRST